MATNLLEPAYSHVIRTQTKHVPVIDAAGPTIAIPAIAAHRCWHYHSFAPSEAEYDPVLFNGLPASLLGKLSEDKKVGDPYG
ncbi:unnamed protein product [Rhizoctonia solani]|uniref:Uncharacterized protein n=1 Tax=Rhizoctonia solani TaxID=456999 RepID=A0A8H3GS10_9AGAM|nr:unnamed protein product [Rhizoctonia solani]